MTDANNGSTPGSAGRRAQAEADARRARARELEAEAARWEAGAEGERMTAAALAELPAGWLVAHDAGVPGSDANLDHVVMSAAGAFLIDSKNLDTGHPIRAHAGTLFRGRYPMHRELETLRWEARQAATMLGRPVRPVICFVRNNLGTGPVVLDDVVALDLSSLVAWLIVQPTGPHTDGSAGSPARSPTAAPSRRAARTDRTGGRVVRRRRWSRRETALAVVALLALIVLLTRVPRRDAVVGSTAELGPAMTAGAAGSTVATLALAVPEPVADYSCPGAGQGWTLTLRWPTGADAATHVRFSWRRPGAPMWIDAPSWFAGTPAPGLGGIAPGAGTEVRLVVVSGAAASDPGRAVFQAPAEPC